MDMFESKTLNIICIIKITMEELLNHITIVNTAKLQMDSRINMVNESSNSYDQLLDHQCIYKHSRGIACC